MNKILFKLIEGKGKFFLNGDLKNGEIVNPEVLPNVWESINKGGKFCFLSTFKELKDGDTFNLPDGCGFEEIGLDATGNSNCGEEFVERSAIRLLPEKPVQKEESQEERIVRRLRNNSKIVMKHMMAEQVSENLIEIANELEELFTIKRKES